MRLRFPLGPGEIRTPLGASHTPGASPRLLASSSVSPAYIASATSLDCGFPRSVVKTSASG